MENSSKVSIPVNLTGVNYLLWSRLAKTALGGRGLWNHVSSGEAPTKTIQDKGGVEMVVAADDKWDQEDLMVLSIV